MNPALDCGIAENPALACGIAPNDSLLVAYLPKLDSVLQEAYFGSGADACTAHIIDGVLLDVTHPGKPVRWWQVRRAAFELKLAMPDIIWQGRTGNFDLSYTNKMSIEREPGSKLYMRAYSHGPWICVEPEQLERVYGIGEQINNSAVA